jgi:hypothetical protein
VLAGLGLLVAVALGSIWTALAVAEGAVASVFLRFTLSLAGGFYYLVMYRIATGQGLARR